MKAWSRANHKGRAAGPAPEAHVRLYRHELECPAYRTLSPAARALLVEMRALFSPKTGDNRVFMSIRAMMARCNLSQRAAQRARDELIQCGWVTVVRYGSFDFKIKHATVFGLENEPPNTGNGSQAGKAFMRWRAEPVAKKHDSGIDYQSVTDSTTDAIRGDPKSARSVAGSTTGQPSFERVSVAESTTQIQLPSEGGFCSSSAALVLSSSQPLKRTQQRRARP
ncbi:MAG: helix-turn-helix domain-containing protein [Dokdonella sp.]